MREVFARPEYRWNERPDPWAWIVAVWDRLLDLLDGLQRGPPAGFKVLLALLTLVLVGLLAHMGYVVGRITRPTARTPAWGEGAGGIGAPELADGRAHRLRAEELARVGRYAEALAHRFVALVLDLERRRALAFHPSKTPAEYVGEARLDAAGRASLAGLGARLYRPLFGGVPLRAGGGRGLCAPAGGGGGGVAPCAGWVATRGGQRLRDSLPVVPRGPELRLPAVASVLKPVERENTPPPDASCPLLVASGADTLLAGRDGRPVVLRLRYPGGGQVTLAADPGYFRNIVWRQTGVAAFAVPLFLAGRRGAIVWDERQQRFGRGGSLTAATLAWLAGAPAGWAMLQLAAVLLVALAVAAVRFGPARRVIDVRRRSPLEHLEALAAGLEGAAGGDNPPAPAGFRARPRPHPPRHDPAREE